MSGSERNLAEGAVLQGVSGGVLNEEASDEFETGLGLEVARRWRRSFLALLPSEQRRLNCLSAQLARLNARFQFEAWSD